MQRSPELYSDNRNVIFFSPKRIQLTEANQPKTAHDLRNLMPTSLYQGHTWKKQDTVTVLGARGKLCHEIIAAPPPPHYSGNIISPLPQ